MLTQVGIAQHRLPCLGQAQAYCRDQPAAGLGLFEKTISVREPAIIRSHFNRSAFMQIPCRQAMEALIQLDTVSTDILHRSEEHTSELQSLMRISYAVFCLKTKK